MRFCFVCVGGLPVESPRCSWDEGGHARGCASDAHCAPRPVVCRSGQLHKLRSFEHYDPSVQQSTQIEKEDASMRDVFRSAWGRGLGASDGSRLWSTEKTRRGKRRRGRLHSATHQRATHQRASALRTPLALSRHFVGTLTLSTECSASVRSDVLADAIAQRSRSAQWREMDLAEADDDDTVKEVSVMFELEEVVFRVNE